MQLYSLITFHYLESSSRLFIFVATRGRGHYMAKKEDFSYEILPYLSFVSHYVSLFSVCYQATNVSPSFLCVTVKQMFVQEDSLIDGLMNIHTDN